MDLYVQCKRKAMSQARLRLPLAALPALPLTPKSAGLEAAGRRDAPKSLGRATGERFALAACASAGTRQLPVL